MKKIKMERTLAIIKPDAIQKGYEGEIISIILKAGFKILAMKLSNISADQAGKFYEVHKDKSFYKELLVYMSSSPIFPIALEKENAVNDFRELIGSTDPLQAAEGTIRKKFAESKSVNAIHGSDSIENAKKEISFFFSESEIVANLHS